MVIYLLLANIAIIISYIIYYFTLRKLTFFQWNRIYLLGSVVFALLIPVGIFIDLSSYLDDQVYIPAVNMYELMDITVVVSKSQNTSIYLVDVLKWIYLTGLSVSLGLMCWKFWQVRELFRSQASYLGFSFFNKMFLGKEIKQYESIERHEQIHIEQRHSYDVLFMEIFKALNWFNPLVYTMTREIKFQHECIADELSSEDKVAYAELLVAHAMKVPHNVLVHEFSNQSFLKKRIMMLFKNKSSKNKRFLYLGIIPAVLVVGLSTLIFNTSRAKTAVAKVESKIEDVKLPTQSDIIAKIEDVKLPTQSDIVAKENNNLNSEVSPEILKQNTIKDERNEIFASTEISPEPAGGMNAYLKWIGENYIYPQAAIDAGVKGIVKVEFIVEKDGSLSDIKVIQDLGHGTGESAVDVMKKSPKWSPGIQNGKPVRVAYALPIRLDLTNNSKDKEKQENTKVEIIPVPSGGSQAFRKWIGANFNYPQNMINSKESGKVNLYFEINKEGTPSNFKVVSETNKGLGSSLVKLIEKYGTWSPAILNGKKVGFGQHVEVELGYVNPSGFIRVNELKNGNFIL